MVKRGDGVETMDFMSNIEKFMTYHFPKDGQDNF